MDSDAVLMGVVRLWKIELSDMILHNLCEFWTFQYFFVTWTQDVVDDPSQKLTE